MIGSLRCSISREASANRGSSLSIKGNIQLPLNNSARLSNTSHASDLSLSAMDDMRGTLTEHQSRVERTGKPMLGLAGTTLASSLARALYGQSRRAAKTRDCAPYAARTAQQRVLSPDLLLTIRVFH